MTGTKTSLLAPTDHFVDRHVGPGAQGIEAMLQTLGVDNLEGLIAQAVPAQIRTSKPLEVGPGCTEHEMLARAAELASQNKVFRSFLGMGYHNCLTPPVILRNILENPGWYTQYTPYQAEIAQGRLEALLNFQTLVTDLTGLELSNASLLDEGTAAAEAMAVCYASGRKRKGNVFFVADDCHPQTIDVIKTRAEPIGVEVVVGDWSTYAWSKDVFGALLQYPNTHGHAVDYEALVETIHSHEALVVVATDLLALTMLRPPGDFGADFAVGNTQRFGVPLGYGGPHAAFFAAGEKYRRLIPGRIVGVSKDTQGRQALRLALQTREQHIRRERATSNICTSQVLLAIVAAMYATYHGPDGLLAIARRVKALTSVLAQGLQKLGFDLGGADFFDTLTVQVGQNEAQIMERALAARVNLRGYGDGRIGVSMDEAAGPGDIRSLWAIFAGAEADFAPEDLVESAKVDFEGPLARTSQYLTHPVWHEHRSETELLRYIHRLQSRDLSLTTSMIPLGSCTMKLNATAEMIPVTWAGFGNLHPFAPRDQAQGYKVLFDELEATLADITGFAAVSLQPNAGSQGEYTGLLVIRAYHHARGDAHRNICLIPSSAHGTNPASAVMAGMKVVVVKCDDEGNIDIEDLKAKAEKHAENLAALMVTYPSTHGVFEEEIKTICEVVHGHGGQVYLDGANLNALVGLCRPGELGADVCHLNMHKTFCVPHGGGGPGMGPIGVAPQLVPFLPTHGQIKVGGDQAIGPVSAAPWGSPSILPISWGYIQMMGSEGLTHATKVAILNANYIATRLEPHYPILYTGKEGRVAHECIIDVRHFKRDAGISVADIAKRLMDYGFHAPTMSWPVAGTLMIEPTESESKPELDRFCDAMIAIRQEIQAVIDGRWPQDNNPLVHAPHTADEISADAWDHPYSRQEAAFPVKWLRGAKFWPSVSRVDDAYGDRNLVCSCPPIESFEEEG